jgi:hypothetical protein
MLLRAVRYSESEDLSCIWKKRNLHEKFTAVFKASHLFWTRFSCLGTRTRNEEIRIHLSGLFWAPCAFGFPVSILWLSLEISGYRSVEYEDDWLLGCCAVWSGRRLPTFQKCFIIRRAYGAAKHLWNVSERPAHYTAQLPTQVIFGF